MKALKFDSEKQGVAIGVGTWGGGAPQNLMGGLKSKHGGSLGELKMLSTNTCKGVHLIVKLPAISLQASKSVKSEHLHTYFSRILPRF